MPYDTSTHFNLHTANDKYKHIYLHMETFCELLEKNTVSLHPASPSYSQRGLLAMSFLYAAVPYSKKNVRMEDAAHCSHKPSSPSLPPTLKRGAFLLDFIIFSVSVTCQGCVTFGCDCLSLIVKNLKRGKKKKTSS